MLFLGVEGSMETQLRELSLKAGITEPERVLVVPFAHWRELEPSLPVFMDQPANPSLKKAWSRLVGPNGTVRR